jgi:hypothetical protein
MKIKLFFFVAMTSSFTFIQPAEMDLCNNTPTNYNNFTPSPFTPISLTPSPSTPIRFINDQSQQLDESINQLTNLDILGLCIVTILKRTLIEEVIEYKTSNKINLLSLLRQKKYEKEIAYYSQDLSTNATALVISIARLTPTKENLEKISIIQNYLEQIIKNRKLNL